MNLGKYELLGELGRGTFGVVYRARDTLLDIEVAVKVLKPVWLEDRAAVTRFYREAQSAAKLEHPNIVDVREMGELEGRLYITMRLIDGESIAQRIKRDGAMSLERALGIIEPIAAALEYAHDRGLVHRDVKPGNILVRKDGVPYLVDFGLARGIEQATVTSVTSVGVAVGTAEYIAPEIWEAGIATPASDAYALACVAYEMLTGKALFAGTSGPMVMRKHFEGPNLDAIADEGARTAIKSCLTANPVRRSSCIEFARLLRSPAHAEDQRIVKIPVVLTASKAAPQLPLAVGERQDSDRGGLVVADGQSASEAATEIPVSQLAIAQATVQEPAAELPEPTEELWKLLAEFLVKLLPIIVFLVLLVIIVISARTR